MIDFMDGIRKLDKKSMQMTSLEPNIFYLTSGPRYLMSRG